MKTMWRRAIGIICAGGLSVICLAGCGKDAAGSPETPTQEIQQNNVVDGAQANNNVVDEEVSGSMGDGEFYDGANLQGDVVEFSETGISLSPATTETDADGGQVLAQAAPGSESDENNVQITYTDDTFFQIITISASSGSELSREDTDKESVKKQSSVAVFGSCQDTYHWTADKILILRFQ
jgi:hypothetical protein